MAKKRINVSLDPEHWVFLCSEAGGPGSAREAVRAAVYDWICYRNDQNYLPDNIPSLDDESKRLSRYDTERRPHRGKTKKV